MNTSAPAISRPIVNAMLPPASLLADGADAPLAHFHWRYVTLIGCMLMGYALDGRAFAYLGYPPLFVAEIMLLVGVAVFATTRQWRQLLTNPRTWPLLGLCAWGALQTLPYFSIYGMSAARDAVVQRHLATA